MTFPQVVNPYTPLVGLTGIGVNSGSLYIGVDGSDPDTSPQACYWDAAGTIAASQPIDVLGGYTMRLGTPARVYTAETYSIRLRAQNGVQVFYEAHAVPAQSSVSGAYATIAAATAAVIPSSLHATGIQVLGYYSAQDGGGARYSYSAIMPTHPGRFQSADGAWWEIAETAPNVRMFGAAGDGTTDDAAAITSALSYMDAAEAPMLFPAGTYALASEVIFGGSYMNLVAQGEAWLQRLGAGGYINSATAADLTYPTTTAPAPMRGSAIYCTTLIYYSVIDGITFSGFRFGVAFLTPHNSPTFRACTFDRCNVGVFCYQGSQNYQLIDCITQNGTGNLFVGSATCFPNATPYVGLDNFYTDGLTLANEAGYGSLQCDVNASFDTWFQASILRPATGTYTATVSNYVYPFAGADPCCNPSGRAIYAPFRAVRTCFFPIFRNVDLRGHSYGGIALINTSIYGLRIDGLQHELVFSGYAGLPADAPWMTLGCTVNTVGGIVVNVSTETQGGSDAGHPFYRFTGSGAYGTQAEAITHLATDIILPTALQPRVIVGKALGVEGFGYNNSGVFDTGISATAPGSGGSILAIASQGTNAPNSAALFLIGRRTGVPTLDVTLISGPAHATFSIMASGNIGVTAPGAGNYAIAFLMSGHQ